MMKRLKKISNNKLDSAISDHQEKFDFYQEILDDMNEDGYEDFESGLAYESIERRVEDMKGVIFILNREKERRESE